MPNEIVGEIVSVLCDTLSPNFTDMKWPVALFSFSSLSDYVTAFTADLIVSTGPKNVTLY